MVMFKSSQRIYLLFVIVGIIGVFLGFYLEANMFLVFIIYIVWILFGAIIASYHAKGKTEVIVRKLSEECDVVAYTRDFEEILKRPNLKNSKNYVMLSLSSGYIESGEVEKGKKILKEVKISGNRKNSIIEKAFYYNNIICCYLFEKDIESAEVEQEKFKEVLESDKMSNIQKEMFLSHYDNIENKLKLLKAEYNGLEQIYLNSFEQAKTNLQKVSIKYNLALLYLKTNQEEKAKEVYKYVAEHGGNMYYAEEAKKFLHN